MGRRVRQSLFIVLVPAMAFLAYRESPGLRAFVTDSIEGIKQLISPSDDVIRYVDGSGRKIYVSSLASVPVEYRDNVEVNPNLPLVNRGEFQPVATPTVTPLKPKRGGDSVMKTPPSTTRRDPFGSSSDSEGLGATDGVLKMVESILGNSSR